MTFRDRPHDIPLRGACSASLLGHFSLAPCCQRCLAASKTVVGYITMSPLAHASRKAFTACNTGIRQHSLRGSLRSQSARKASGPPDIEGRSLWELPLESPCFFPLYCKRCLTLNALFFATALAALSASCSFLLSTSFPMLPTQT